MQRITEFKTGKKSIFKVETVIDGAVVDSKMINVQIDTVTVKNKEYNLLYNSSYELVEDAYNFLNHNQKRLSANSIKAEMYALRYLYVFSEIINKPISEFTRIDFIKLNYFLSGVSADGSEVEYNLLTKRNSETINSFFSVYRELYRYLDLTSAPILNERSFAKYTPAGRRNKSANITNVEVPKYISVEEFQKIISYIIETVKIQADIEQNKTKLLPSSFYNKYTNLLYNAVFDENEIKYNRGYYGLLYIGTQTGLRASEIAILRVQDLEIISFRDKSIGVLHYRSTKSGNGKNNVYDEGKTNANNKVIAVYEMLASLFKEERITQKVDFLVPRDMNAQSNGRDKSLRSNISSTALENTNI
ncbi:MAG: hypothetical protein MSJ26_01355, partial [Oscillospiraceae bacterium]|nr:hypothetical protein [Oscillospiraceae bacterium]